MIWYYDINLVLNVKPCDLYTFEILADCSGSWLGFEGELS